MMKLLNFMTEFLNNLVLKLPSPFNLNYFWNMGSMLLIIMFIQIMSGILLTFYFTTDAKLAFFSIEYFVRMSDLGVFFRWIHMNLASFFFVFLYFHMFRGLFYGSFMSKDTWNSGVTILLMIMAIAFMGYVLPWGQMSFWAATVITKFFSVIPFVGTKIIYWLWSGFSVNNLTLKFFFSLHFLLPMVLVILVLVHMMALHFQGSSSPIFFSSNFLKIMFSPFFLIKDILNILILLLMFFCINIWISGESVNFIEANYISSPAHIKPEWYFLFAYAILRSIPQKLMGVILMALSLMIFYFFSLKSFFFNFSSFSWHNQLWFFMFFMNFIFLSWVGGNPVTDLFVILGQLGSTIYFFLLVYLMIFIWFSHLFK